MIVHAGPSISSRGIHWKSSTWVKMASPPGAAHFPSSLHLWYLSFSLVLTTTTTCQLLSLTQFSLVRRLDNISGFSTPALLTAHLSGGEEPIWEGCPCNTLWLPGYMSLSTRLLCSSYQFDTLHVDHTTYWAVKSLWDETGQIKPECRIWGFLPIRINGRLNELTATPAMKSLSL